jgi:flagellar biosynthesis protein
MSGPHTPKAVALAYDPLADGAPRVVGKGGGPVAERIIDLARERGIPIHSDPGLLSFLMRVDFDDRIPPELYGAVAAVLALAWAADQGARLSGDGSAGG